MDHKEKDDFDVDIQACSTMDCTGLIPSLPQDEAEKEAYEDLLSICHQGCFIGQGIMAGQPK